jgi:hypothetical protein
LCDAVELEGLRAAIALTGNLPRADDLDGESILRATIADKKASAAKSNGCCSKRSGAQRLSVTTNFRHEFSAPRFAPD